MPRAHTRPAAALAAVLLTGSAVAGCAGSGHPGSGQTTSSSAATSVATASPPVSAQTQIVITNFAYQPADLTVSPGQKITVVNHDSTVHTLTVGSGHTFDTGRIDPGASATFTAPTTPGRYPYICTIHQFMHGTLTVRS